MTDQTADRTKALDILHTRVRETLTSETWKAALDYRNGFHRYSLNNCLLIQIQRPGATLVAGFNAWKEKGRSVMKGEKGIAILAPMTKRITRENADGDLEKRSIIVGWRTAYVFDVEQTDGADIPTTTAPKLLDGYDDVAGELIKRLTDFVISIGWTLDDKVPGAAMGVCRPLDKSIGVRADVPALQQAKTLTHEIVHALLHSKTSEAHDYQLGELEAETGAYLVLNAMGLDTSDYSFAYLANWTRSEESMDDLIAASARATKAADEIVDAITTKPAAELSAAA